MIKYRIKTEKEFLDEFGFSWKDKIQFGWSPRMNFLFGTKLEYDLYSEYLGKNGRLDLNSYICIYYWVGYPLKWNISADMIKEIKIVPDYNEKRILVYD